MYHFTLLDPLIKATNQSAELPGNVYVVKVTNSKGNKPMNWQWCINFSGVCANAFGITRVWNLSSCVFKFIGPEALAFAAANTFIRHGAYITEKVRQNAIRSASAVTLPKKLHSTRSRKSRGNRQLIS